MRIRSFHVLLAAALLVGVAVCVLTLNIARAHERRLQLQSMIRLRSVSIALERYLIDHKGLPASPALTIPGTSVDMPLLLARDSLHRVPARPIYAWPLRIDQTVSKLRPALAPAYVFPDFPSTDAWGRPIIVGFTSDLRSYTLLCLGSDGRLDPTPYPASYSSDEHWRDILFVGTGDADRYPGFASGPEGISWP